jgi:NodT family efflux transporter outer membrane factor (OMF) lipoprotein
MMLTLAVLLGACAQMPMQPVLTTYQQPEVTMPTQWQSGMVDPQATLEVSRWWTHFKSVELEQLIAAASDSNYNLKAAVSRITQARALAQIAGVPLLPALALRSDVSRGKSAGDSGPSSKFNLEFGASFEVDLWGKNRQAHEAALSRVQASVYAQQLVKVALQSEVAIAYFQILSASDRLVLARSSLNNAEALLQLLQIQFQSGAISGLEVERQQGLIVGVRASIPPIELERQSALDALAILLGRAPQGFTGPQGSLASVQLPSVAAGLPSTLLERRSDIRQIEANLTGANADINAARAAFFPSIQLTAAGGLASKELTSVLRGANLIYNIVAGLTAPIFNRGRLQGEFDFMQARQEELLHNYQQSILVALREVEGGLATMQRLSEQSGHQQQSITHAQAALRIVELRYRNGASDFTTVLDAQRVLLAEQTAQEQVALSRYIAAIGLYRALGGGWKESIEISTTTQPKKSP